jgi:putative ABC transport system permease protein
MNTLHRKLVRDLAAMWGQAFAIALVIASGVATYIMSISTFETLSATQQSYYRDYRLADVFTSLKRAPNRIAQQVAEISGVDQVETRIQLQVNVDIDGFTDPISGLLISLPDHDQAQLNRLYLRQGRYPEFSRDDEVVLSEPFAQAHGLQTGDKLSAIINGHRKTLRIVGIALSPEHIYVIQPGTLFPDAQRYGVLWMARTPLAVAYNMEGAFNDLALSLFPGTTLDTVLEQLDLLLANYGGIGSYGRADQTSNRFMASELQGLEVMAAIFPVIFMAVALFLLNMVMSRLVGLQREQIAVLKAFGYRNSEISWHYGQWVIVIVLLGVTLGTGFGAWLGQGLSHLYGELYHFPYLIYQLRPAIILHTLGFGLIAAMFGTLLAIRRAVSLPPAEAMRPEPPAHYHASLLERLGLYRMLSQPSRMILRNLHRQPLKALFSIIGIALACAILVVGSFQEDAVDYMVTVQFHLSQKDDLNVAFTQPRSYQALYELRSLPGVSHAEPQRTVPAQLSSGQYRFRTGVQGIPADSTLYTLLDTQLRPLELPPEGLVLSEYLAQKLRAQAGDWVTLHILDGSRPLRQVQVAAVIQQYIGVAAYMELVALNRLLGEGPTLSSAALLVDEHERAAVFQQLKTLPKVAGATHKAYAIRSFYDTMGENLLVFAFINTLLAATITFGVVYNSARIALSERSRELASLRVLGFTRAEVGYILLGELGLLTLLAIPLGFIMGRGLCAYMVAAMSSDLYQIPLITEPSSYAFAASVVLICTLVSGLLIGHKLKQLDLVGVLKTKE